MTMLMKDSQEEQLERVQGMALILCWQQHWDRQLEHEYLLYLYKGL